MPIKKAAFKALKQSKKNRLRNLKIKAGLKISITKARRALGQDKKDEAKELVKKAIQALDRVAGQGIIKKNTASRLKSRLVKKLNSLKG